MPFSTESQLSAGALRLTLRLASAFTITRATTPKRRFTPQFILVAVWLVLNTWLTSRVESGIGLVLVALGLSHGGARNAAILRQ